MGHSTKHGRVTHRTSRAETYDLRRQPAQADPEFQAAAGQTIEQLADPYEPLTKDELVEKCRERGLPVTGNKADLATRLREADAEQAAAHQGDQGDGEG